MCTGVELPAARVKLRNPFREAERVQKFVHRAFRGRGPVSAGRFRPCEAADLVAGRTTAVSLEEVMKRYGMED